MIFRPLRSMLPYGYGIVRDLVGHGIGTLQRRFYAQKRKRRPHRRSMTLTGDDQCRNLAGTIPAGWLDGRYKDGSLSAHYENTILVTDGEPEILTLY